MTKQQFEKGVIALFLVISLLLFIGYNMHKPSILIIHSYDKDYAWVRDVNLGLNRVLNHPERYHVRWHYMDTKRHPYPDFKARAGITARHAIDQMQPDVVIALDDDAQQYVSRYYLNDPHIKLVFAGVNNGIHTYGFDRANNVTGMLERLPVAAMRESLLLAKPLNQLGHPLRIAFLGDQSESVSGDAAQIQRFNWDPIQLIGVFRVNTWEQWQSQIKTLEGKADLILVTGYRRLSRSGQDKALVPASEVVAWSEANSPLPLISGNGFFAEDGGMLAIGTSPYEQGEEAAQRALAIVLDGTPPNKLAIGSSQQFTVTMRASRLKARGIELPKVYEAAARIGNHYYP